MQYYYLIFRIRIFWKRYQILTNNIETIKILKPKVVYGRYTYISRSSNSIYYTPIIDFILSAEYVGNFADNYIIFLIINFV